MADYLCPGCGLRLSSGSLGSAPLDLCLVCGGVWLNIPALCELMQAGSEEIHRLYGQVRSVRRGPPSQRPARGCPHCDESMGEVVLPDLPEAPIFACAPCRGFWLTGEALEQLAGNLDMQGTWGKATEPTALDSFRCS